MESGRVGPRARTAATRRALGLQQVPVPVQAELSYIATSQHITSNLRTPRSPTAARLFQNLFVSCEPILLDTSRHLARAVLSQCPRPSSVHTFLSYNQSGSPVAEVGDGA